MESPQLKFDAERLIAAWTAADPLVRDAVFSVSSAFPGARGVFLVGGAIRDKLLDQVTFKDLDFVVDVQASDFHLARLPDARRNFFGGLTFKLRDCGVDVWPLCDTYHIKNFGLNPTVDNLLAGAPFNLDRIAFEVRTRCLFELGFFDGLRERKIVYAPPRSYLEPVQAARCILLRRKTGFSLDGSAVELLARVASLLQGSDQVAIQIHEFLLRADGIEDKAIRHDVIAEIVSSGAAARRTGMGQRRLAS